MNLIAFFQNTDWGFWQVIVAVIFGLIATAIAIITIIKSQKRKSLSYEVLTDTKLVSIHKEAKDRIEILFDGKSVKDVSLLIFRIVNDGNVPISSADFEVPLTLVFDGKAEILSAEIIKTSEDSLKPKISHTKSKISVAPTLLNAKDDFQIKSLIVGYKNEFTIDTRIVGVKNITKTNKNFRFIYFGIIISTLMFLIVFVLIDRIVSSFLTEFGVTQGDSLIIFGFALIILTLLQFKYVLKKENR